MSSDDDFGLSAGSDDSSIILKETNNTVKGVPKKQISKRTVTTSSKTKAKENKENNDEDPMAIFRSIDDDKPGKPKSIEDQYQKKTQLEHILLRPDTYVGSIQRTDEETMWVFDNNERKLVQKKVTYVPGLYKIFDEIIVNAADNKQRDKKMNCIKVSIDAEANKISVLNNGKGIPVVEHKIEKMYVPELIFGTLLTSSNYDDSQRKITGGRNGFGAKLCNVFSSQFTVETSSKEYGKQFKQTWTDNMTKTTGPTISKSSGEDFTKITFKPDLKKFKMDRLDDDIVSIMMRRAYDMAGILDGVRVFLNNEQIKIKDFEDMVKEYLKDKKDRDDKPLQMAYEKVNDRWQVACAVSEDGFQQVSFVNSIATTKGGRHVDYIFDMCAPKLREMIEKKFTKGSNMSIKPSQIKQHVWLFVNCSIENPTFDSQTKEALTLQSKMFGSKADLSDKFIAKAAKIGIVEACQSWARAKQIEQMDKKCSTKKTTKVKGIAKLEDANEAGTKNSNKCTLILTEGDSAKTLAVSGLGVVGRDYYGVFPLKGKLLNVREASHSQLMNSEEINALIRIIGLQYKKDYKTEEDLKTLRYGKVMIMADQDQDGSHIKGLVINFIHHNWPSLVRLNFVEQFITPIVKVTKGKIERSFFSLPEYVQWKQNTPNWNTWHVKYYKGLGTSTAKEAKEYFSNMQRHRIKFRYGGINDDNHIKMAFAKDKVDERKDWLTKWMNERRERRLAGLPTEEDHLYNERTTTITFDDFVNKELVLFSNTDNERSIPSLVDGLKPGQRKVLYTCFKRNDKREVKVAQLAGSVAERSAYHHGEMSLMMTIINLAQNYVGSNNINPLLPIGQFGTRLQGGKDSASPRYIFTMLNPVTRTVFPLNDDFVLKYLNEDNQRIEPEWYCPIIPMVLVNGAQGIGTGWSTNIPNYNPRDLVDRVRILMYDENAKIKPLVPWYKNFRGTIIPMDDTNTRFVCYGEVAQINDTKIEITELPIKTWTHGYKEKVLEPMMGIDNSDKKDGKKAKASKEKPKKKPDKKENNECEDDEGETKPAKQIIEDFKEYHTDTTVKFVVSMPRDVLTSIERSNELHRCFKLQTVINTSSMVLFDAEGVLRRYNTPEEILRDFVVTRRNLYLKRKNYMVGLLKAEADRLSNQAKFILDKISGTIVMENKKKKVIVERLIELGYDPDPVKKWRDEQRAKELSSGEDVLEEDEEQHDNENDSQQAGEEVDSDEEVAEAKRQSKKDQIPTWEKKLSDFDYLVTMALIRLSEEEVQKLLEQKDNKHAELEDLRAKSETDLWNEDLDKFLEALDKQNEKERQDELGDLSKKTKGGEKSSKNKKIAVKNDFMPSPAAIRVQPRIDSEMRAKYEKIEKAKDRPKGPRIKLAEKMKKNEDDDEDLPLIERVLKHSPHLKEKIVKGNVNGKGAKSKPICDFFSKKDDKAAKIKKGKKEWETDSEADEQQSFGPSSEDDIFIEDDRPLAKKRRAQIDDDESDDEPATKRKTKAFIDSDDDVDNEAEPQKKDDKNSRDRGHTTSPKDSNISSKMGANNQCDMDISDSSQKPTTSKKTALKKTKSSPSAKPKKASKKPMASKSVKKIASDSDAEISEPDAEIAAQPIKQRSGRQVATKKTYVELSPDESESSAADYKDNLSSDGSD